MASKWNPNRPNAAGSEWFGVNPLSIVPSTGPTSGVAQGMTITSTATETIDTIYPLLYGSGGTAQPLLAVDVYPIASVVNAQSTIIAVPIDNYFNSPNWQQWNSGVFTPTTTTAWTYVDKPIGTGQPLNTGSSTALVFNGVNLTQPYLFMFNAGTALYDGITGASGPSLTSKRISIVQVEAIGVNETNKPMTIDGYIQGSAGIISSSSGPVTIPANSSYVRSVFSFYFNGLTGGLPWSNGDAVGLTTGATGFGIGIINKAGTGFYALDTCQLRFTVSTETRLATGFGFGANVGNLWAPFTLVAPSNYGAGSWSKVNGTQYAILFSSIRGNLAALAGLDNGNTTGELSPLLTGSNLCGLLTGPGAVPTDARGLIQSPGQLACVMTHSGTASVDSNSYVTSVIQTCGASSPVHTQGISVGSAQAYGTLTVLCATTPSGAGTAAQNAPMTVSLKRTSDNAVLIGPLTINTTDVPADGQFHVVALHGTPSTLTNLEAVYIECDSSSTVGWQLPGLLTYGAGMSPSDSIALLANNVGIGGTADKGDANNDFDFPWNMIASPNAPSGFAVTVASYAPSALPPGGPTTIHYAAITWTGTSLGASFGNYQIQRQDGTIWNTIGIVTGEANSFFYDVECLRNVATSYRMLVSNNLGGLSAFTSTITVTVPTDGNCDLIMASNWDPVKSLAYQEYGDNTPLHNFARANAQSTVVHLISGSQAPVGFRPLVEGETDVFQRTLIVSMDTASAKVVNTATDRAAFDALLALIEDNVVPYVALLDGHGRRWYTFPEFVQGNYSWEGHEHDAVIKFTECAVVPAAPTFALAPAP